MTAFIRSAPFTLLLFTAGCGSSPVTNSSAQLVQVLATDSVVGKQGKIRVVFDNPVAQDSDVTLTAAIASVAKLPAKITVPRGSLAAEITFDGLALGTTQFIAGAGDANLNGSLRIVDHFSINGLDIGSSAVEKGGVTTIYADLNASVPTPTAVTLTVDDKSVASLSAGTATVSPYSSQARGSLSALAPGVATITATIGSESATSIVTVVDHARLTTVDYQSGNVFEVGTVLRANLELDAAVAKQTAIAASSSDATVAAAPTGVVVQASGTEADFTTTVLGPGATTLTFTLADSTATATVYGVATAHLTAVTGAAAIGQDNDGQVQFDAIVAAPRTVTLSVSDPTLLAVPAQVVVPAGAQRLDFPIKALLPGTVTLTATFGSTVETVVIVVAAQSTTFNLTAQQSAVMVGAPVRLELDSALGTPTQLTSSDPTVVSVPSVSAESEATLLGNALKPGTATITATNGSATATVVVTVVAKANFGLPTSISLQPGATGYQAQLFFEAQPPAGVAITFTSANPKILAAPATLYTDGSNGLYVPVPLYALTDGTTVLTVSADGFSHSVTVQVGANAQLPPYLNSVSISNSTLEVGAATTLNVQLDNNVTSDTPVTIALSPANSTVVTLPQTSSVVVTGQSSIGFPVVAQSAGTVMITASSGGVTLSATVTVLATPTFSMNVATALGIGATTIGSVSANCFLASDRSFTISGGAGGFVSISPATVTVSGADSANFVVTGVAAGAASVTATPTAAPMTPLPPVTVTVN